MKKKLGLGSGVAICVGLIVATSCLVSLGTGMGSIGRWFIIPLFAVMVLNWFIGISFAELNGLMPRVQGGTGQYLLAGMGPLPSLIGNLSAYVITEILSMTAEITLCGLVLKGLFLPHVDNRIISIIIMALFLVINLFGVDIFSKVQNIVVFLLIGSMVLIGLIGVCKLGISSNVVDYAANAPTFEQIGGFKGLCSYAALAFWLFIGVEFIIPVAKDLKNPRRDVLLSMTIGLVLLFFVQSILGIGMTNYVSLDILANDPAGTPHMTYATNLLGNAGRIWMGIITILAAASTINTVYASVSRIVQGMGEEGMMPSVFAKTNKRGAAWVETLAHEKSRSQADRSVKEIQKQVLKTPAVWILAAASAFMYISRYAINGWGVLFLQEAKGFSDSEAISIVSINALLGILGTVLSGWFSDKLCKGDRKLPALLFGILNSVALTLFLYGGTEVWVNVLAMVLFGIAIGVLICFLGGLMAVDIVPRKATGAALGVVGVASYCAAGIQDVASGWLIDAHITVAADGTKVYDFAPVAFFWIAASVISFLLPLLNWKSNVSDKQAE